MSEILWYLPFSDWIISLSIMFDLGTFLKFHLKKEEKNRRVCADGYLGVSVKNVSSYD